MRDGRSFEADLAAVDGLRATFTRTDMPPVVIPFGRLAEEDMAVIRDWRRDRRKPLVLPEAIAAWPKHATAPRGGTRSLGAEDGRFIYQSENFHISSDLDLPRDAVDDIATVFEATRAALIAIPLGFHAGGESGRYRVHLFRDEAGYAAAGGVSGSGGHYDGRSGRMLVLLPNLGIAETGGRLRLDHRGNTFILKHEVVHQLMAPWHRRLPMWVGEGIAEFIASLPYSRGAYTLLPPGAGMRDYLLKWQPAKNDRTLRIIPPARLMPMDAADWNRALARGDPYDLYNSSSILTYHFILKDRGAPLAAYLDALRRGEKPAAAERTHLLDGRDPAALAKELAATARTLGIEPREVPETDRF